MSIGTPNFIGSRLTEAREARGLTQTALAEVLGLTRAAISLYESGRSTPSSEVLVKISHALRVPMHRFLRAGDHIVPGTVFYRSMSAATKSARERAERRYGWLRETVSWLRHFVEFQAVRLPKFDVPTDPAAIAWEDIERLAAETRRAFGIGDGPISHMVLLLENHGCIVARQELGAHTLDAFSNWGTEDQTPYFVLGSDKASAVRSRFDAAHELAHCVLHKGVRAAQLRETTTHRLIEDQAHYFAGAFLLPREPFANDLFVPSLNALVPLKSKWKVSIGAMIKRAANLGFVSDEQEQRLFQNRARRGWASWEPLDDELELEQPRFLQRCFDMLLDSGVTNRDAIESELGLFVEDIESIVGLPTGYFGDSVQHYRFPRAAF
ncbi:MAG TPA: helix-turn-helix domain-containing protein [Phycisphaerales bacterium]|nr:helix-turn-helix domain-containing protein [Phycisphaerales bacterium]